MTSSSAKRTLHPALASALALLATAAVAPLAGCAGQGDIDRTQPDKVEKSIFFNADGTAKVFYYRQTYIGVPPTSNWAFEGTQNTMMKVRFQITQDYLVGYRANDYAPGSENDFTSTANNTDTPVVSYSIKSHFDVKREYNPATGEQTNVISENTTDRPWDQRQYMRVDWSTNFAAPPDLQTAGQDPMDFFAVKQVPHTWTVSETDYANPEYGNRPIISQHYIDFVQKVTATPDYVACSNLYPGVDDGGPWDCGDAELAIRNSFMEVKPSSYEPLDYPDNYTINDSTGNPVEVLPTGQGCTADQLAASGGTYSGDDCSPAQVGAFSKFGFFRTVIQTYDRKYGATEAGREYFANRWNIWADVDSSGKSVWDANGNLRTIPLNDKVPKPIVYYTNVEFPDVDTDPDLTIWNEAQEVAKDWSSAMNKTIAGMLLTEGNKTGTVSPTDLDNKAAGLTDPNDKTKPLQMVILKRNSCNLTDVHAFLAAHADVEALVQKATGLAGDKIDKANLEHACGVMEAATASLADGDAGKFTWQRNGDLRYSFVHWVDRYAPSGPLGYGPSSADPQTGEIVSASIYLYGAALDTYAQFAVDSIGLLNGSISTDDLLSGKTINDVLKETAAQRTTTSALKLTPEASAKARALVTKGGTTAQGTPRLIPIPGGTTQSRMAKIKGTDVEQKMMTQDILAAMLPASKPGDTLTPDQLATASPATWLTQDARDARSQRFQQLSTNGCVFLGEFADDAIQGLALELMKKGLTGDAMFKELRKRIFRGLTDHEMGHTMGLRHNFAGSSDALNYNDQFWALRDMYPDDTKASDVQSRSDGKMQEYQYSTVMDYGSRFNSDINGLGKYDLAAIRFGYGGLVDVMSSGAASQGATGTDLANFIQLMDYKKLPDAVGGTANLKDGGITRYQNVRDAASSFYAMKKNAKGGFPLSPERPYKFCSDEYVGNLDCKVWDFGANQTEIVDDTIDRYKNYFVFNAFKRGRTNWTIDGYLNRLLDRYFARFTEAYQFYYYYGALDPSLDLPNDLLKASIDSLNAIGEILQTPEPGEHCPTKAQPNLYVLPDPSGTGENTCVSGQPSMNIDVPDGKPYYINFSEDYYYRITRAGSLYEKLGALIALTTTQARFYRVDTFADSTKYAINYYSAFKPEMINLLSGVIRMDSSTYGGQVTSSDTYAPTPVVDLNVWGKAAPTLPAYMQPGAKRVDTPVNKTIQYYALGLALANLDNSWDSTLDLSNYLAVTIKGSKEDVDYGVPTVEYQHPQSGVIYRAPVVDANQEGVGEKIIKELVAYTGVAGTPGSLPEKEGTFNGQALPDWQTAKANVDAAQAAAAANKDATMTAKLQQNYQNALNVFQAVDYQVSYRVDLLDDLRTFRTAFGY
ncbi:MAG TPA: zinc-dependent metalloprotease [Polyangia bacterium]|nr:zinc-dependent metalloprotease [Polyangia bacterium]